MAAIDPSEVQARAAMSPHPTFTATGPGSAGSSSLGSYGR